jgi:diguanylate cyclase (GGDEF)-like protein
VTVAGGPAVFESAEFAANGFEPDPVEPDLALPRRGGLDPVTGLADRVWFLRAVAVLDPCAAGHLTDVGIIATRLDGLKRITDRDGQKAGDGLLLLTAEVFHSFSRGNDVAARQGADLFALLAHVNAADLTALTGRLRAQLVESGVSAIVGSAMCAETGGAAAALRRANRMVTDRSGRSDETTASRAVFSARRAIAARVDQEQATGILMQWHHCTAERARLELAYQAHEMGLAVTVMARLLIAMAAGDPLTDEDAAHGIELQRSLLLAANLGSEPVRAPTLVPPRSSDLAGSSADYAPAQQMQPIWSVRPPNAATGLLSLPSPDVSSRAEDLMLAGRYQGARNPSGSGGDWFDAFVLPDGTAALILGDVAGHGALASTTMMQLRTLLRGFAISPEIAPSEVLRRLDRFFVHLGVGLLATAFFGWVQTEPQGGLVLRWCNAGHLPPVLLAADGETMVLECRDDLLLGLEIESNRTDLSLLLPPESTLLLYSDGLIETRTADLDTGLARLRAAARSLSRHGVAEMCDELVSAVAGNNPYDDVTLLAVRVPPHVAAPRRHNGAVGGRRIRRAAVRAI